MAPHLRRMKPYHPRKRRAKGVESKKPELNLKKPNLDSHKQVLSDLRHKISADVGSLVVFIEEGNTAQIELAQQKTKSDLMKHSAEMQKIAEKMGDRYIRAVRDYLDSVDTIVHTNAAWIDEAKIRHCYTMAEKLEKELTAA